MNQGWIDNSHTSLADQGFQSEGNISQSSQGHLEESMCSICSLHLGGKTFYILALFGLEEQYQLSWSH